MSSNLLTAPEREGKTFNFAIRVLGTIAVFQILLVIWAVLIRFKGEEINRGTAVGFPTSFVVDSLADPAGEGGEASSLPAIYAPAPDPEAGEAPAGSPSTPGSNGGETAGEDSGAAMLLAQNQTSTSYPPAPIPLRNHLAHRITIPEAEAHVSRALKLREEGDTKGALEALRDADKLVPSHPKILAEIATTLQKMGLDSRAAEFWERVHQMRPEGAGAYWDLADMALKGQILDEASSIDTYLRITRHTARSVPGGDEAQQVALRIHIEAAPNETVSGEDMYLNVLFYDVINGTSFEPTVADTRPSYVSAPYDWFNGAEEIIEVEYFLPKLTSEQQATLGQRRFYGYVVELYYKDLLQDIVASPRKLARLGSSGSRAARPVSDALPKPNSSPESAPAAP